MKNWTPYFIILIIATAIFAPTVQTIPNGSSHYLMIDVGEMQVVLNNWGTPHATGYPLYVMTGNILTSLFTAFGVPQLVAPVIVSWLWGALMLAVLYWLARHLNGGRIPLAALIVLAFALTRSLWIHFVVAEIYTFALMFHALLLAVALSRIKDTTSPARIYWLAFLGGLAVAHHRATIVMIPALLIAVWPHFRQQWRHLPRITAVSLALGVLGFLPYAYLYIRGRSGADWVYGQPGTLSGLWDEIIGREAERFIGLAPSFDAFWSHLVDVNMTLIRDITLPGIVIGVVGLLWAMRRTEHRRSAVILAVLSLVAYLFHAILYRDVLSALILLVTLPLIFGWMYSALALREVAAIPARARVAVPLAALVGISAYLAVYNTPFIGSLTGDQTGVQTIQQINRAPEDSTVMLAWGTRYFAASAEQILRGGLSHITLIDDKVDYAALTAPIITPEYTFFNQPLTWWRDRLTWDGLYLSAAAPYLVAIDDAPRLSDAPVPTITPVSAAVMCADDLIYLDVVWQAPATPPPDLSIFVHGLADDGALIAQGDQSAPVYGWRPFSTWRPHERVRDIYPLSPTPDRLQIIRYGLYRTTSDGGFENVYEFEIAAACND